MSTTTTTPRFDSPDRLNEDGSVTFRIIPSNWRRHNISPDTYQTVNGDSADESTLEYLSDEHGLELTYDDCIWSYDHAAIVRDFAEVLSDFISERLMDAGLDSLRDVTVHDSWSPQFYNFQSDGFEMEMTCDPAQLRALTDEIFNVESWAREYYRSVDGFMSFVTSRMEDEDWYAGYDAEFRVEALLGSTDDRYGSLHDGVLMALVEAEHEVYDRHTTVEVKPERLHYMDSGYTLAELEEWADSVTTATDPSTDYNLFD